jgi:hypothetical protein
MDYAQMVLSRCLNPYELIKTAIIIGGLGDGIALDLWGNTGAPPASLEQARLGSYDTEEEPGYSGFLTKSNLCPIIGIRSSKGTEASEGSGIPEGGRPSLRG